jgi:hypothetical protein
MSDQIYYPIMCIVLLVLISLLEIVKYNWPFSMFVKNFLANVAMLTFFTGAFTLLLSMI